MRLQKILHNLHRLGAVHFTRLGRYNLHIRIGVNDFTRTTDTVNRVLCANDAFNQNDFALIVHFFSKRFAAGAADLPVFAGDKAFPDHFIRRDASVEQNNRNFCVIGFFDCGNDANRIRGENNNRVA